MLSSLQALAPGFDSQNAQKRDASLTAVHSTSDTSNVTSKYSHEELVELSRIIIDVFPKTYSNSASCDVIFKLSEIKSVVRKGRKYNKNIHTLRSMSHTVFQQRNLEKIFANLIILKTKFRFPRIEVNSEKLIREYASRLKDFLVQEQIAYSEILSDDSEIQSSESVSLIKSFRVLNLNHSIYSLPDTRLCKSSISTETVAFTLTNFEKEINWGEDESDNEFLFERFVPDRESKVIESEIDNLLEEISNDSEEDDDDIQWEDNVSPDVQANDKRLPAPSSLNVALPLAMESSTVLVKKQTASEKLIPLDPHGILINRIGPLWGGATSFSSDDLVMINFTHSHPLAVYNTLTQRVIFDYWNKEKLTKEAEEKSNDTEASWLKPAVVAPTNLIKSTSGELGALARIHFSGPHSSYPALTGLEIDPNTVEVAGMDEIASVSSSDFGDEAAEAPSDTIKSRKFEVDENGNRVKRRKTKEEKIRAKESRLDRLRSFGLLGEPKRNIEEELNEQLEADMARHRSAYAWKSQLPKLVPIKPGYFRSELKAQEAQLLHRPRLKLVDGTVFHVSFASRQVSSGLKVVLDGKPQNESDALGVETGKISKNDLTCSEGNFVLTEYTEKFPTLTADPGMPFVMLNFWCRKEPEEDAGLPAKQPPEFERGLTITLEPKDKSPFLAELEPEKTYTAVYNDLFVAPVALQNLPKLDEDNLFMIVTPRKNAANGTQPQNEGVTPVPSSNICYIRKVKGPLLVVGQTEPQFEAFHPTLSTRQSEFADFLEKFIPYQVLRKLAKSDKVTFQQVKDMLPSVSETFLLKVLKSEFDRAGNGYVKKLEAPDVVDFKKQISPRSICKYESLQRWQQLLFKKGISLSQKLDPVRSIMVFEMLKFIHLSKSKAVNAIQHFMHNNTGIDKMLVAQMNQLTTKSKQEVRSAEFILNNVLLSSWNVSSYYVNMHLRRGQPNNRFNNIKMRLLDKKLSPNLVSYLPEEPNLFTIFNKKRRRKNAAGGDTDSVINGVEDEDGELKKGFGGTEYDLRRLSLEESENILRAFGIEKALIDKLDRWDRIMVVEDKASSEEGKEIMSEKFSKFARSLPKAHEEAEKERKATQRQVNDLFQAHLAFLGNDQPVQPTMSKLGTNPEPSPPVTKAAPVAKVTPINEKKHKESDEEDDDDIEDLLEDIESSLQKKGPREEGKTPLKQLNSARIIPPTVQNLAPGQRPKKILKRTFLTSNTKGEIIARIVYTKSKKDIEKYRLKVRAQEKADHEAEQAQRSSIAAETGLPLVATGSFLGKKRGRKPKGEDGTVLTTSEDQARALDHERQRVQQKKLQEREESKRKFLWYQEQIKQFGSEWPKTVQGKGNVRCGACFLPDHKANSKKCPLRFATVKAPATQVTDSKFDENKLKMSFSKNLLKKQESSVTVTLDTSVLRKQKLEEERLKQQQRQEKSSYAAEDIYGKKTKKPRGSKDQQKSRRYGPVYTLSTKLVDVLKHLATLKEAFWFRREVPKKNYPEYYNVIHHPMDLTKMRKKLDTYSYNSTNEFVADLQLILDNSIKFNTPLSPVTQHAEKLLEAGKAELTKEQALYDELDAQIREQQAKENPGKSRSVRSSSFGSLVSPMDPSPSRLSSPVNEDLFELSGEMFSMSSMASPTYDAGAGKRKLNSSEVGFEGSLSKKSKVEESPSYNMYSDSYNFGLGSSPMSSPAYNPLPSPSASSTLSLSKLAKGPENGPKLGVFDAEDAFDMEGLEALDLADLDAELLDEEVEEVEEVI